MRCEKERIMCRKEPWSPDVRGTISSLPTAWLRAIDTQVSHIVTLVLFNTNFPIVVPKFSNGKEERA